MTLVQNVEQEMAGAGYPAEERGFTGHLTLARVREGTGGEMAPKIRATLNDGEALRALIRGHEISVREIVLMRSILASGGAVYERLAAFPLGSDL